MIHRVDFHPQDTSRISSASSDMVIDEIERAADHAADFSIEWVDADHGFDGAETWWTAIGHAFIEGEPFDVEASYAVDRSGAVAVSRVVARRAAI